jgi:hypothetical protein
MKHGASLSVGNNDRFEASYSHYFFQLAARAVQNDLKLGNIATGICAVKQLICCEYFLESPQKFFSY